jgi:nitrous oxidase accessory protein
VGCVTLPTALLPRRARWAVALFVTVCWIALNLAVVLRAQAQEQRVAPGDLAAALTAAQAGDTLRLLPGIHPGPLEINVPVRLVGEPGAFIEGGGAGTVLTLSADGIELADLVVRGSGADLATDDAVILLFEVEAVSVQRCRVEARGFGIYVRGGGGHRIIDNVVEGDSALEPGRRGNGIHLWDTVDNEVTGNVLIDVRDGVYLSFAHDNVIQGNRGRNLRYGIHYMYSERNELLGNEFSAGVGGIALMYSLGNRIVDNVVAGNRDFGILMQQLERSVLERNHASGNGRGIYLENSAANRLIGNRLMDNGVGAYLTAGSERNVFSANRFDRNLVQVYEDHAGENQWHEAERGNSWSDYTGFDWDGDGIGEVPYRLQTAASALLVRRPVARWFWKSPILGLLDWWHGWLPGQRTSGFDLYPLVGEGATGSLQAPLAPSVRPVAPTPREKGR